MIAIFLMPIAVVDSIHIISDFFEKYQVYRDKKKTIIIAIDELFMPMLYTSLTSAVGFASLAAAPIPPVQVFGIFVAFGIMAAWILTMTFIPASVMFLSDKTLKNFGTKRSGDEKEIAHSGFFSLILNYTGRFTFNRAKLIITVTIIIGLLSVIGISKITINDNPVKWFDKKHEIRIADRVLNKHFGGTYMAFLIFEEKKNQKTLERYFNSFLKRFKGFAEDYGFEDEQFMRTAENGFLEIFNNRLAGGDFSINNFQNKASEYIDKQKRPDIAGLNDFLDEFIYFFDDEKIYAQTFKQPEMLNYIDKLQEYMQTVGVGKSTSLSTIVKKVYMELRGGKPEFFKVPDSAKAVGESLIQYQNRGCVRIVLGRWGIDH